MQTGTPRIRNIAAEDSIGEGAEDLICVNMADVGRGNFEIAVPETQIVSDNSSEVPEMWDWFPIIFFPLKILVLGVAMFFAIKWHHDQAKKK